MSNRSTKCDRSYPSLSAPCGVWGSPNAMVKTTQLKQFGSHVLWGKPLRLQMSELRKAGMSCFQVLYINRGRGVLRWPPNCAARLRKSTIHPHSDHSRLTRDGTMGSLNNALYAKLPRHLHLNNMSFRWILLYSYIVNYDIFLSFIGTRAHMRRAQFSVQTYSPRHIRLKHT